MAEIKSGYVCDLFRSEMQGRRDKLRLSRGALNLLMNVGTLYLINRFRDSNLCTVHRGRVTLKLDEMLLVDTLRCNVQKDLEGIEGRTMHECLLVNNEIC